MVAGGASKSFLQGLVPLVAPGLLPLAIACGESSGPSSTADGRGGTSGDAGTGGSTTGGNGTGGGGNAWFEVIDPLPSAVITPEDDPDLVQHETVLLGASADGRVVFGTSWALVMDGGRVAVDGFRWTREGGIENLGYAEEPPPEAPIVQPRTISRDGSVIFGSYGPGVTAPLFRWSAASGMVLLETLDSAGYVELGALSDDGGVLCGAQRIGGGSEAVRWTEDDGLSRLGFLPGEAASSAAAISADGETVVGASGSRVYRFTPSGGMEDLGLGTCGVARDGLSGDGAVVVGRCTAADGGTEAFVWNGGEGKTSLGTLPASVPISDVEASPEGRVVVAQSRVGREDYQAVRASEATGFVRLGSFPGLPTCVVVRHNSFRPVPDTRRSSSRDGSVVAGTCITTSGTADNRGFRWSEQGGLVPLEPLAGDVETWVTSVSPDGIVGGMSIGDAAAQRAVIWDASGAPRAIATDLEAAGVDLGGFRLDEDLVVLEGARVVYGVGHDAADAGRAWIARLP